MLPHRIFIGTDLPPVVAAADWLLQNGSPVPGELNQVWVGVSGSRSVSRLTERLVQAAAGHGVLLRPPAILTTESLANRLVPDGLPIVPQPLRLLAWVRALREMDRAVLGAITPLPPEPEEVISWAALGEMVESIHTELATAGLRFSDVPARGAAMPDFDDAGRWQSLVQIDDRYQSILSAWGYADPNTARLQAIGQGVRKLQGPVVLVAVGDLNTALEKMLEQSGAACTVLIPARPDEAGSFDAWGRPKPEEWAEKHLIIGEAMIRMTEEPADQADAVLQAIGELNGSLPAESITLGLADAELGPVLRQHLTAAGLCLRDAQEKRLEHGGVCRLLSVAADYLESRRLDALMRLLRHPDIEIWMAENHGDDHDHATVLNELDQLAAERLAMCWAPDAQIPDSLRQAVERIENWLARFHGGEQEVKKWAGLLLEAVTEIYGSRLLDPDLPGDAEQISQFQILSEAALAWTQLPGASTGFAVVAPQAIRLLMRSIAGTFLPPPHDPQAIEALRWIELLMDDAPAAVVAGLNEGAVPRSYGADAFLPERLRRALGLADSAVRYAQDAHALNVILATRKHLTLIAGRRGADGSPRLPSRLLLAASPETVAKRILKFFPEQENRPPLRLHQRLRPAAQSVFQDPGKWPPPPPDGLRCDEPLPVTAFRDYLACPYRFCLKHVLKLRGVDEPAAEMDARTFGNLSHDVLADFGRSACAASEDPQVIAQFCSDRLDAHFVRHYGIHPAPALLIQREQLRRRLKALADWQAAWAADGWRIQAVEEQIPLAQISGLNPPLAIRGRIDRIDFNARLGSWAILDYKTGDRGQTPEKTHQARGAWVDLQLPLYRHLAAAKGLAAGGQVSLGYIVLSADPDEAGARLAEWTAADLAAADAQALKVGAAIRAGNFYPPNPQSPRFDDFAAICGTEQFLQPGMVDPEDGELPS